MACSLSINTQKIPTNFKKYPQPNKIPTIFLKKIQTLSCYLKVFSHTNFIVKKEGMLSILQWGEEKKREQKGGWMKREKERVNV